MRHFLSITGLDVDTLAKLVEHGLGLIKTDMRTYKPLAHKIVGIYFRRSSTRTRTSFSTGALKLGAQIVTYGPNDLQLTTGETPLDTARVLSSYLDAFVMRTNDPIGEMQEMAKQDHMPIINAMSDNEHPTQVIGDLITLREALGELKGLHVVYLGEGNNTAASLALATALSPGMRLTLLTPAGFGLADDIMENTQKLCRDTGSIIEEHHDVAKLPKGVDAVYTTRWETMGVVHEDPNWRDRFRPFMVTETLMEAASKDSTIFMHDLPAIRGSDTADAVLDGQRSWAWRQAFHKQTSAMTVLEHCLAE